MTDIHCPTCGSLLSKRFKGEHEDYCHKCKRLMEVFSDGFEINIKSIPKVLTIQSARVT